MTTTMHPDDQLRSRRLAARDALLRAGNCSFKPTTSAKWTRIFRTCDGRRHVQIEHDTVKGCTPAMLQWWFEHIGGTTTWNGRDFSGPEILNYHLWHHRDHVSVRSLAPSDAPGLTPGGTVRVEEWFGEFRYHVDDVFTVDKLDEHEMTFTARRFGVRVATLIHRWNEEEGGSRFYTETIAGLTIPLVGVILNWILLPLVYSRRVAEQWLQHNIEETGQTEKFLPALYAQSRRKDAKG